MNNNTTKQYIFANMLRLKVLLGLVLFFLISGIVAAQDIQFTVSVKPEVVAGETFSLTFSVNGQGVGFKGPAITGLDVLSGPNTSTRSSIQSINGRTSMSITYTYTYILQASKEGTFQINAASVTVDNKVYQTNPVTVKVVSGGTQATPPSGNQPGNSPAPQSSQSGPDDVYLKVYVDKDNPYLGEEIVVTYKLYTKVPISQISINKLSSFQGFWSQNLIRDTDKFNQYNQVIDGEQYVVADIRKIALFPLKTGKLIIDPLELECVAQVRRQSRNRTGDPFFDDFFNNSFFSNSYASVEKLLKSNALTIQVRSLPDIGKPADFNGAVGNFTFHSEIDKTEIQTNEPISLKFTVSGEGNIQLIDDLKISFPPDFETYDPKITSTVNTGASGVSGRKIFEYLIIPRKAGSFSIKPVGFSFYDLSKKKYVSLYSPEFIITVERGTGESAVMTYSGAGKEEIKYIGSDIRHIISQPFILNRTGRMFFGSISYFLFLIIPFILFLLLLVLMKKQQARRSDAVLMKNLKATRIAKKRLKKADHFLRQVKQEEFYIEISQALWGYLSDKFGIPLAELSMDSVQGALTHKKVSEEIIRQFIELLNEMEFARFAPGDKALKMDEIYRKGLEIIMKIERNLR